MPLYKLVFFGVSAWILVLCGNAAGQEGVAGRYRQPSDQIVAMLTASPPPTPVVHVASKQVALLYSEAGIDLKHLARPYLGLAGFRFNPGNRTSGIGKRIQRIEVVSADPDKVENGSAKPVSWVPEAGTRFDYVEFSPDGKHLSALLIGDDAAKLVVFNIAQRKARTLTAAVNSAWGKPCDWVADDRFLCQLVPADLPSAPQPDIAPAVVDHTGNPKEARTYSNLLRNVYDEELFEHYFTSELANVWLNGKIRSFSSIRGLITDISPAPDDEAVVLTRIKRPYSYFVRASRFPSDVEVWDLEREELFYSSSGSGPKVFGRNEPGSGVRRFEWKSGKPLTLGWIEKRSAQYHWIALEAPFNTESEIVRTEEPIRRFTWSSAGNPFFVTANKGDSSEDLNVIYNGQRRKIGVLHKTYKFTDPDRAIRLNGSSGPVFEHDGHLFITGSEPHPRELRPFLHYLSLADSESKPLFTAEQGVYERVIAVIDPKGPWLLTSRETETDPPALFLINKDVRIPLHRTANPYPQLESVERRMVSYQRRDGVDLKGIVYLPAGRKSREKLPTLIWIYPYEHEDRQDAERLDARFFRFHHVRGPSPLAAVLAGYAVLVNPTVPIIGDSASVNDRYLEQLVGSVDAAADHLVSIGVAAADRVAVGGQSYGAFSSANLLIHSKRFATAITVSGAYNRTLTPFGFQREKRSFWEASEVYTKISPFFHVDQIRKPILIMHGGDDENPGTPLLQARRFFHALLGTKVHARYVELPFDRHHFLARKNILHAAAEMIDWLDATIGEKRQISAADS